MRHFTCFNPEGEGAMDGWICRTFEARAAQQSRAEPQVASPRFPERLTALRLATNVPVSTPTPLHMHLLLYVQYVPYTERAGHHRRLGIIKGRHGRVLLE